MDARQTKTNHNTSETSFMSPDYYIPQLKNDTAKNSQELDQRAIRVSKNVRTEIIACLKNQV